MTALKTTTAAENEELRKLAVEYGLGRRERVECYRDADELEFKPYPGALKALEAAFEAGVALGREQAIKEALDALSGEHYGHDTGELYDRVYNAIRALGKDQNNVDR